MSLWNYIGEFFLFQWLFGKQGKSDKAHKNNSIDSDYLYSRRSHKDSGYRYDRNNDYNRSFNNFHEEQDDYDMMDDI